ncbi:WAT1-related protein At2g37450-like isoform X2 [Magnolia sinica]|uniref:WAT1-related protein At2g37450-like isoform X2 n=1 Tax=Magnolia sinica TaxID=86752 RepID=UPI002659D622|nr:WAT1-related protein At2g37450-like isoform X2 [Magnolia sinica]
MLRPYTHTMSCRGGIGAIFKRFKPHLLMVFTQFAYIFLYFFTEASFKHGMNPHVYVTYRHFVAGVFMFPFAYFLEKVSLSLNMYFVSLRYTSPMFVTSMINTIASLTFLFSVLLRLERLDRSTRGMAKIVGTLVSLAGVTVMTLYKGPVLRNLGDALIHVQGSTTIHESWIKGPILTVAFCVSCALWYIMQAITLKKYPAQLSLTTWMSLVGGAQSAVFTACMVHKPKAWTVGFNIDLWNILYCGVVVSGLVFYIQLWCNKEKGPVFVTLFNPLGTMFVALLAYFVLGEKLHAGSIIGGVIVIIGLYLLLWGKEGDHVNQIKSQEPSSLSCEEPKEGTQDKSIHLGGERELEEIPGGLNACTVREKD